VPVSFSSADAPPGSGVNTSGAALGGEASACGSAISMTLLRLRVSAGGVSAPAALALRAPQPPCAPARNVSLPAALVAAQAPPSIEVPASTLTALAISSGAAALSLSIVQFGNSPLPASAGAGAIAYPVPPSQGGARAGGSITALFTCRGGTCNVPAAPGTACEAMNNAPIPLDDTCATLFGGAYSVRARPASVPNAANVAWYTGATCSSTAFATNGDLPLAGNPRTGCQQLSFGSTYATGAAGARRAAEGGGGVLGVLRRVRAAALAAAEAASAPLPAGGAPAWTRRAWTVLDALAANLAPDPLTTASQLYAAWVPRPASLADKLPGRPNDARATSITLAAAGLAAPLPVRSTAAPFIITLPLKDLSAVAYNAQRGDFSFSLLPGYEPPTVNFSCPLDPSSAAATLRAAAFSAPASIAGARASVTSCW